MKLVCMVTALINAIAAIYLGLMAFGINLFAKMGILADTTMMNAEMGNGKYILMLIGVSGLVGLFGAIQWMRGCHSCSCGTKAGM